MKNGPRAPLRSVAGAAQAAHTGLTEAQQQMMRRNHFFYQIKTAIGFVLACTSAGFLITLGQHLAIKWLG